jgi:7-alpha-hydroxysteroid dehydrogenase
MEINQLFSLKDKVAIVTGGGNGIGKACAIMLSKAGASIAVSDLKLADAQSVADEIVSHRWQGHCRRMQRDRG